MDTLFLYLKKFLVLTVFVVFTFAVTYIPLPTGQHSTVPVAEATGIATFDAGAMVQRTASFAKTFGIFSKEFLLDGIAWGLAKAVVSSMAASTVTWINSGFKGSPAFVQDLDRFLLDVADAAAGAYLQELGDIGTFLCSPFQLDIQIAIALQYQTAREKRPYEGCRISETFENFESFVEGNFLEGGWEDWITITAEPEKYTGYGQLLTAENTFNQRLLQAKDTESKTLTFGNGFLSQKVCEEVAGPNAYQERCRIVTPGQTISDNLSKVLGSGQDALITADEIDEIIGALISQLAVKAITGTAGLLGLSANTGYTYGGYDSGSYLGDLERESQNGTNSSLARASTNMLTSLSIQKELKTSAQSYDAKFAAALSNPKLDPEKREALQRGKVDTLEVLLELSLDIPELEKLVADYQDLEKQLASPTLSQEQKKDILTKQSNIINKFVSGEYFTKSDLDAKQSVWASYLSI